MNKELKRAWWGRKILEQILINNLSEKEIAKRIKIKETNLHRIIEGKYSPSFETMEKIFNEIGYNLIIE